MRSAFTSATPCFDEPPERNVVSVNTLTAMWKLFIRRLQDFGFTLRNGPRTIGTAAQSVTTLCAIDWNKNWLIHNQSALNFRS
jgi:hypothetical protein